MKPLPGVDPPLVKGGQGHPDEEIYEDGNALCPVVLLLIGTIAGVLIGYCLFT